MKLGKAIWQDPERSNSIVPQLSARMERRFKPPFRRMTCWSAQDPAQACLTAAFEKLGAFLSIPTVRDDLYTGVFDGAGLSYDRFMHGSNIKKAQPTIICSSKNPVLRANAARIIESEGIEVDNRGIGLEFYKDGPVFSAGSSSNIASWPNSLSNSLHRRNTGVQQDPNGRSLVRGYNDRFLKGTIDDIRSSS
jgi:hypothetical protein